MKNLRLLNFAIVAILLILGSCGGSKTADQESEEQNNEAAFLESQPLGSGLYDATYYDITGENSRKGQFDGRVYFAVSPELTAIYVFENGNRTKISYYLAMKKPFEKNDEGTYTGTDSNGGTILLVPDSTSYNLKFDKGENKVDITFNKDPRSTGDYMQILEKINEVRQKQK